MSDKKTNTSQRGRVRRTGVLKDKNRPAVVKAETLGSREAQDLFVKTYKNTEIAIFSLKAVLPALADIKAAEIASSLVREEMEGIREEIDREIALMKEVREQNDLTDEVVFTEPREFRATISTQEAALFLGLIRDTDTVISHMTALWVAGFMSDKERTARINDISRRIHRLSRRLTSISDKAIRKANQQRHAEQQKAEAKAKKDQEKAEGKEDAVLPKEEVEAKETAKTVEKAPGKKVSAAKKKVKVEEKESETVENEEKKAVNT